tara:strand:- start:14080 stop:16557 length:2478 start_codon:yes stop_codon:yes gene_type:complete
MRKNIRPKLKEVVREAMQEVLHHNGSELRPEHVILSIVEDGENRATDVLLNMGVDLNGLFDALYDEVYNKDMLPRIIKQATENGISSEIRDVFSGIDEECANLGETVLDTAHMFLSAIKKDTPVNSVLIQFGITYKEFKEKVITMSNFEDPENEEVPNTPNRRSSGRRSKQATSRSTPVLDSFCRDISASAERGEIDPVVGRDEEIKRVTQILSRRKKNNPVLIGDPGVGKTSIVEGLAKLIYEQNAPMIISDKRIFSLNLASLVAGTKYRGQFEERMKALMDELKDNPNVILFIDELHTMVGAGAASGSLDASNIFKPALANGEIQIIGATTLDEFRENVEKDGALTRRFQKVLVNEPSLSETLIILENIKDKYEEHHKVTYTQEAIEECVRLSDRYITERAMPDKAIDVLDEAGAATNVSMEKPERIKKLELAKSKIITDKLNVVRSQNYEEAAELRDQEKKIQKDLDTAKAAWISEMDKKRTMVGVDEICDVISTMTGIPISKISSQETKKLLNMSETIKKVLIGQDDAVETVTQALKRNRLGIKPKNKPIGSFIFLGPTGVGKTELAKQLALQMFGDSEALVRIDMSEYREGHTVSRMLGSPPGYVGHEKGGQLTEEVRRRPYSVVLFDEIEKAHPDIFNTLLQLLDEGHLTDGLGRKVSFKNCLVIMTSNVGVKKLNIMGAGVGFKTDTSIAASDERKRNIIEKALKQKFPPEFLNRLDEAIIFNSLTRKDIDKIIYIELDKLRAQISDIGYDVKLDKAAIDYLAEEGYHEEYGARPLARVLQKVVGNLISDHILMDAVSPDSVINVSYSKDKKEMFVKV